MVRIPSGMSGSESKTSLHTPEQLLILCWTYFLVLVMMICWSLGIIDAFCTSTAQPDLGLLFISHHILLSKSSLQMDRNSKSLLPTTFRELITASFVLSPMPSIMKKKKSISVNHFSFWNFNQCIWGHSHQSYCLLFHSCCNISAVKLVL